jgi:hypothetical protein
MARRAAPRVVLGHHLFSKSARYRCRAWARGVDLERESGANCATALPPRALVERQDTPDWLRVESLHISTRARLASCRETHSCLVRPHRPGEHRPHLHHTRQPSHRARVLAETRLPLGAGRARFASRLRVLGAWRVSAFSSISPTLGRIRGNSRGFEGTETRDQRPRRTTLSTKSDVSSQGCKSRPQGFKSRTPRSLPPILDASTQCGALGRSAYGLRIAGHDGWAPATERVRDCRKAVR